MAMADSVTATRFVNLYRQECEKQEHDVNEQVIEIVHKYGERWETLVKKEEKIEQRIVWLTNDRIFTQLKQSFGNNKEGDEKKLNFIIWGQESNSNTNSELRAIVVGFLDV